MSRSGADVIVLSTEEEVARRGADEFISAYDETVAADRPFSVALAGGSTPVGMYELLAGEPYASRVDWDRVHFYWGDERCVPPDHPDSNYGAAARAMLTHLGVPETRLHRMQGELDPPKAAQQYEQELRSTVDGEPPRLDLILLGMGDDGHTASLFPHTAALRVTDRLVVANYVPNLDAHRLTFTVPLINAAHRVVFLVTGAGKAEALRTVLSGDHDPDTYPSQLVSPTSGRLTWLLDEPAARLLS